MFWTVRGANAILALRCSHLNGRFEDYWTSAARLGRHDIHSYVARPCNLRFWEPVEKYIDDLHNECRTDYGTQNSIAAWVEFETLSNAQIHLFSGGRDADPVS
jgi:hypothetical protein